MPAHVRANDNAHLKTLVAEAIAVGGLVCDLNHIDVAGVTDFSDVFAGSVFNGNISGWHPTRAMCMNHMFAGSQFTGDISKWRMPNLRSTMGMFEKAAFSGDISQWSFPSLSTAESMFAYSQFNGDVSSWDMSAVRDLRGMFRKSAFAGDLSTWALGCDSMLGGMLGPTFGGSLPTFKGLDNMAECRTGLYETMFGGGDQLQMYLARRPFDHGHAAFVMDIPARPMWLPKEDFVWLRSFRRTGLDLGMEPSDILQTMVEQYRQYKAAPEPVSLAGMDLE